MKNSQKNKKYQILINVMHPKDLGEIVQYTQLTMKCI